MKKTMFAVLALLTVATMAQADEYVNGYVQRDGTYVQGYVRSDSNSLRMDNYSSQGNTNPYTRARGHERNELSAQPEHNGGRKGGTSGMKYNGLW